ncbi:hypothetical protein AVEN_13804-1 [Araneus ventricosus]|uniref:Uncharacterized protein n=1 Tax=Araneus ventricosus TaxID=182803 RepID=A0A4Y2HWP6_ARAVE|nr:hypothetical protein AVEN_13804-1 [Araneus ventricosus]
MMGRGEWSAKSYEILARWFKLRKEEGCFIAGQKGQWINEIQRKTLPLKTLFIKLRQEALKNGNAKKNEIKRLQGDIKNFKEDRNLLLLQIQEKNKNVENLKSNNDSLVKINAYNGKKKSGKLSFRKGEIVAVRRNPKATGESTNTQPLYRGPKVVTEILPSDTYTISQLEPSNGSLYVTTAHVSQLKVWKSWYEDDDNSSRNSDYKPEMQRPNALCLNHCVM